MTLLFNDVKEKQLNYVNTSVDFFVLVSYNSSNLMIIKYIDI